MVLKLAKAISFEDLPDAADHKYAAIHAQECLYGYLSKPLIDDLSAFLKGLNVVEAYAGRGNLSALLRAKGISIKPTSLRSGHDGSSSLGHVIDVENIDVCTAVNRYREWLDVLLVCWPVADNSLYRALSFLPEKAIIIFIGEVTDYSCKPAFLGGCASDEFFDAVEEIPELTARLRYPTLRCDTIKVYRRMKG